MTTELPSYRILLAATPGGARQTKPLLASFAEVEISHTPAEALSRLREPAADLVIVSYHFDELRPYRLIRNIKETAGWEHVPILLIRALPFRSGKSDAQSIKDAYVTLGATDVISLEQLERDHGSALAASMFREHVLTILNRSYDRVRPLE